MKMSEQHAYRFMDAAAVADKTNQIGEFVPPTEAAARPFTEFRDDKGHLDLDHVERAIGDLREENDHLELIAMAARKCGRFLLAMTKAPAGRPAINQLHDATNKPPTLADLGIKKNQSVRLQCMALVPDRCYPRATFA